ncbi:thiol:disulfide interchange protein DsbA/DsbL [Sansalvadorimonas verongulae]|uniref:thiol:disulfide interchange protein DsbA/DsbL n=1 Tax=Sansalvadorimonas verongulae TaxID=2172824 RepID=UPI0012BB52BA|nr:thiol:disulfide interchange protein DsbA/DsbL [Sansalvadorimonas verongulae]MTI12512.1 thiol:disulfide interchange protein DsbA/DsbL [Sansalvadorimonas verongulae]
MRPLVQGWKKTLPSDVSFREVPALFREEWRIHGQLFFTLKALGLGDDVDDAVYHSIHVDGNRLNTREDQVNFVKRFGVSEADFDKAHNSFGVRNQLRQADAFIRGADIPGVPTLVINGKYRLSAGSAGGQDELLKVAEFLIKKERDQKKNP